MASMGSPGVRWISAKTPALTRRRTGTVARRRRRTRRPTARASPRLLHPHVLEAHHAVGNGVVTLHAGAERLGLDGMDDEHHRQLLVQQTNELAVELLALRLARHLPRLVEQGV